MLEYETTGIIRVNSGYIGLTRKQADARRPWIKPTPESGVYEVMGTLSFKAGETIGLENPDKSLRDRLALTEKGRAETARRAAAVKKAEEEAAARKAGSKK